MVLAGLKLITKDMSEDKMLSEIHLYVWNNFPELRYCSFHVANERTVSKREGAILKAKGVVSGIPDYIIFHNGKTHFFEMKTESGVLSENQKKCHFQLKKQGFHVEIIRSFLDFKNYFEKNIIVKF